MQWHFSTIDVRRPECKCCLRSWYEVVLADWLVGEPSPDGHLEEVKISVPTGDDPRCLRKGGVACIDRRRVRTSNLTTMHRLHQPLY